MKQTFVCECLCICETRSLSVQRLTQLWLFTPTTDEEILFVPTMFTLKTVLDFWHVWKIRDSGREMQTCMCVVCAKPTPNDLAFPFPSPTGMSGQKENHSWPLSPQGSTTSDFIKMLVFGKILLVCWHERGKKWQKTFCLIASPHLHFIAL